MNVQMENTVDRTGTDMMGGHGPLQTPFDRKKAAAIGLRKWVRFAKNGETTIMQVSCCKETRRSLICCALVADFGGVQRSTRGVGVPQQRQLACDV